MALKSFCTLFSEFFFLGGSESALALGFEHEACPRAQGLRRQLSHNPGHRANILENLSGVVIIVFPHLRPHSEKKPLQNFNFFSLIQDC